MTKPILLQAKVVSFTACLICSTMNYAQVWVQLGTDIDGEAAGDRAGNVALSGSGERLVIGGWENDDGGLDAGHVRVFEIDAGSWSQIGNDIDGDATEDLWGGSVAISGSGTRIASSAPGNDANGFNTGVVRVYEDIGGQWSQIGGDINGTTPGEGIGSVSLSESGDIVAIGSALADSGSISGVGRVRVFELIANVWVQIGNDLWGEHAYSEFGAPVSLSANGNRLAVGARANSSNGINSGSVRIFEIVGASWNQVGSDLDGDFPYDVAYVASLSADGMRVAIGAEGSNSNGVDAGQVRVFEDVGGNWTQLGQNLNGTSTQDGFGSSVSISADGNSLSIGARYTSVNSWSGLTYVYTYSLGSWNQIGASIEGESPSDFSGIVSLSSNGQILAIGAGNNDGNGSESGHVRVFELSTSTSTSYPQDPESFEIVGFPNPAHHDLTVTSSEADILGFELYDINGRRVRAENINARRFTMEREGLAAGSYFLQLTFNKGNVVRKVVLD